MSIITVVLALYMSGGLPPPGNHAISYNIVFLLSDFRKVGDEISSGTGGGRAVESVCAKHKCSLTIWQVN